MKKVSIRFVMPCLAGAWLALSIVGMANAQDPPRFRVTDLGALGFTPNPDDEGTLGISNRGEVVYSIDVNGERHAMLWLPEPNYNLAAGNHDLAAIFPAFDQPSIARDISVHGKIAGQIGGILAGEGQAMVWDLPTGTLQLLGVLPVGMWSRAMAINDATPIPRVVGESEILSVCDLCDPDIVGRILRSCEVALQDPLILEELVSLGCEPSSFARDVSIPAQDHPHIAGFSHRLGFEPLVCVTPGECQSNNEAVVWLGPDLIVAQLPDLEGYSGQSPIYVLAK